MGAKLRFLSEKTKIFHFSLSIFHFIYYLCTKLGVIRLNDDMSNRKKGPRSRRGMQVVTLCISTTMVLILLGIADGLSSCRIWQSLLRSSQGNW